MNRIRKHSNGSALTATQAGSIDEFEPVNYVEKESSGLEEIWPFFMIGVVYLATFGNVLAQYWGASPDESFSDAFVAAVGYFLSP